MVTADLAKDESSILSTSIENFYTVKQPCIVSDFDQRDEDKPSRLVKERWTKDDMMQGCFACKQWVMEVKTSKFEHNITKSFQ